MYFPIRISDVSRKFVVGSSRRVNIGGADIARGAPEPGSDVSIGHDGYERRLRYACPALIMAHALLRPKKMLAFTIGFLV